MGWGIVAGIAGSLIGGKLAADGAKSAARTSANAADRAAELQRQSASESLALQERIYNEGVARQQPVRDLGVAALYDMSGRTSPVRPTGFETSPGYQFRLEEGQNALMRQAGASGMALSGAALKDSMRYGQGLASDEYGAWWNRETGLDNQKYNRLASIAGAGQVAGSQLQNAGSSYANAATNINSNMASGVGNALMQAGNARASGYQGSANAWGDALSGVGSVVGYGAAGGFGPNFGFGGGNNYRFGQPVNALMQSAAGR